MKEDEAVVDVEEAVVLDESVNNKLLSPKNLSIDIVKSEKQENKSPNIHCVNETPPMSPKKANRKNRKKKREQLRAANTPKAESFVSKGDREKHEKMEKSKS